MKEPFVFVVGTAVLPELDEKFNKWYDEVHIPMLLESKLLDGVTRYKLAPTAALNSDDTEPSQDARPRYLAHYVFKDKQSFEAWWTGPELAACREEMKESGWRTGVNFFRTCVELYEPLKSWHK